jgi:hypothetical protein
MRAEPFVAIEPPFAVLVAGDHLDRADIGTAGPLGHELGALPQRRGIVRQHLRQQIFLQLGAGEFPDQMDRGVGDADRAHQPELGLHEQILQRIFGDRRQRTIHAERTGAVAHGVELKIPERDILHLAIGRMIVDPVFVAAQAIARIDGRWMLVGGPRELIQPSASQFAEAMEMRLRLSEIIRREIKPDQVAQTAVDGVEMLTRAVEREMIGALRLVVPSDFGA